jgi:hypothetical protein
MGGRFEGVETLLGRSERGRFVKAPIFGRLPHKDLSGRHYCTRSSRKQHRNICRQTKLYSNRVMTLELDN